MNKQLTEVFAVLEKEIRSEIRNRYSITSLLLFIVTTITIVLISISNDVISSEVYSALIWLIIFFSAMLGLSKVFISEVERGTDLLLKLYTNSTQLFVGKLLYNIILCLFIDLFAISMYLFFISKYGIDVIPFLFIIITLSSIGLGAVSTIISSIIAKVSTKNALFPVLSFPILLPIILPGIKATTLCLDGNSYLEIREYLQIIFGYDGIIIVISYILFDFIWND